MPLSQGLLQGTTAAVSFPSIRSQHLFFPFSQLANAEVCGTDGVTYRNECELKQAACRKQQFIVVASSGDCGPQNSSADANFAIFSIFFFFFWRADLCKKVRCDHGARCEDGVCVCPTSCPSSASTSDGGICANDGRTYASECHMQRAACDHGLALQVLHPGPCPTPPADLILAADYHDASMAAQNGLTAARQCHCNKQGT